MSALTFDELDKYIGEIISGEKLARVPNSKGKQIPLLFRHPSRKELTYSDYIYKEAYNEALEMELPTVAAMEVISRTRGLFTEEDERNLNSLIDKLKGQKAVLAKTTRVPARRDRLMTIINDLEQEIVVLHYKKEKSLEMTCERKAAEEKLLYLTWAGTHSFFNNELYWPTREDFFQEKDFSFRRAVFLEYTIFFHGLNTKILREVSRSNLWRIRYVTALKTSDSLFGRSISEYTNDQLMLLYWSHYYQSIYEMLSSERPSEEIIDDDDALDAYMKEWQADKNRETAATKEKNRNKYGNPSAWDFKEVLVTKSNELYKDIEYSPTLANKAQNKGKISIDAAPTERKGYRG